MDFIFLLALNVLNSDLRQKASTCSTILVSLFGLTLFGSAEFFFQIISSAIVNGVFWIIDATVSHMSSVFSDP